MSIGGSVEREAFARAWRFMSYRPAAKWAAVAAGIATAVFYIALLLVLGLFADLMVSRGRIPSYHELSQADREFSNDNWAGMEEDDRRTILEKLGIDPKSATLLGAVADPT